MDALVFIHLETLGAMAKGKVPYDAKAARDAV